MGCVLSLTLLAFASQAWACSVDIKRETRHAFPAALSFPRDLPVGGVIYDTRGWIGSGEAYVRCMELYQHYIGTGFTSGTSPVPGLKGVYTTSLPGVGVRVGWAQNANNLPADIMGGELMQYPRARTAIPRNHYAPGQRWWIQLIKTSATPSNGSLSIEPVRIYYDDELTNELMFTPSMLSLDIRTCRLGKKNIDVTLRTSYINSFKGVGSTSRPLPFDIPLMCDPEIRVSYTISGLYDDLNHSVLKNSAGSGLAKGVGVQLLKGYGDQAPIQLGNKTLFGNSGLAGGNHSIPLVARYYQTEKSVSAGRVNILAYFNLYYE
ncbi:fimbrial protein [Pseudomonas solani]|uniref:fimbrial protein n=1 Tax=Pseudomonas solani TaxID=2731552 RepID=UPI003C307152